VDRQAVEAFQGDFFDNIFTISAAVRGKPVPDIPYKDAIFLWQTGSVTTTPYITAENKAFASWPQRPDGFFKYMLD
jgi:hypothetical protein